MIREFYPKFLSHWKNMGASAKSALILTVILVCLVLSARYGKQTLPEGSDAAKFNSTLWKATLVDTEKVALADDKRQGMLQDLVDNYLAGKTKMELIALLGNSDYEKFRISESHLIYVTGWDRYGYGIDSEWLVLFFDGEERFVRYELWVD